MAAGPDLIAEINDAVARGDLPALAERLHPDVVWRHNVGLGTFEEGEYTGRESVIALFERILEPWEYLRPRPHEVRDAGDGAFVVTGELQIKHTAATAELVTPYEQRLEVHDGLITRGELTSNPPGRPGTTPPGR